jgi:hypothetical protein
VVRNSPVQDLTKLFSSCTVLRSLELVNQHPRKRMDPYIRYSWSPDVPNLTRMKCSLRWAAWPSLSGMTITALYIRTQYTIINLSLYGRRPRAMSRIFLPKLEQLTCDGPDTSFGTSCYDRGRLMEAWVSPAVLYRAASAASTEMRPGA